MSIKEKRAKITMTSAFAVFSFTFLVAFLSSSLLAPSETTNADRLFVNLEQTGYSTSVASSDNIVIDLKTTPTGSIAIAHDTVKTITNNPSGYKLYVSSDQVADYDLTHPGNALYQDGNSTSRAYLSPTTGTISAPDALSNNSWGFAVLGNTVPEDLASKFDPVYIDSNGDSSADLDSSSTSGSGSSSSSTSGSSSSNTSSSDTASSNAIIPTNKFAAMPLASSAALVASSSTATSDTGNDINVYYGVKADMSLPTGTYIGTVSYYILPEASVSSFDTIAVSPNRVGTGEVLTISTSLYTNYQFSNDDIVTTLTKTSSLGSGNSGSGGGSGSGSSSGDSGSGSSSSGLSSNETGTCSMTEYSTDTGNLIFNCIVPEGLDSGEYTVEVVIADFDKDWTTTVDVVNATTAPAFWQIRTMQEMTPEVCNSVYTPRATDKDDTVLITNPADYTATKDGTAEVAQSTLYDINICIH